MTVNSGIFLRFMSIILSIMDYFLSTAQKHNRQNFEHSRLGPKDNLLTSEIIVYGCSTMNNYMLQTEFFNRTYKKIDLL